MGLGHVAGDMLPGVFALAAPIFNHQSEIVGVVAASGPKGFIEDSMKATSLVSCECRRSQYQSAWAHQQRTVHEQLGPNRRIASCLSCRCCPIGERHFSDSWRQLGFDEENLYRSQLELGARKARSTGSRAGRRWSQSHRKRCCQVLFQRLGTSPIPLLRLRAASLPSRTYRE